MPLFPALLLRNQRLLETQPTLGLPEWGAQSLASFYPVNEIPLARFHLWNLVHNKTRQNGGRQRATPVHGFPSGMSLFCRGKDLTVRAERGAQLRARKDHVVFIEPSGAACYKLQRERVKPVLHRKNAR